MTKKSDKNHFFIHDLKTANENDRIYDPFGIANTDDGALIVSIKKNGIQEPLIISTDGYVLSGHRRLAAAKYLRMEKVPVRKVDVVFEALDRDERLKLLRSHNLQRDKTPNERIREELVTIDPDRAYLDLKRSRLQAKARSQSNIEMGISKVRPRITTTQFLKAVQRIIEENEEYLPLTDRRVHYLLLNAPPLRHDKKPQSLYRNDKSSYKALTGLLIRARLSREIPMDSIEDTVQHVQINGGQTAIVGNFRGGNGNFE